MSERADPRETVAMAERKQASYAESRRQWAETYWRQVAAAGQSSKGVRATETEIAREKPPRMRSA